MRASIEFLGVEWVGDRPVLVALAPLLGSMIVAVVAAYAARLAAKTANHRQREQLEHAADRQREQLAHDRKRQRKELVHDRKMRKQEHARNAIDAAIELVAEVQKAVAEALGSAEWMEDHRDTLIEILNDEDSAQEEKESAGKELFDRGVEFKQELIDANGKALEMFPAGVRLRLRLGSTHSIPVGYLALKDAWEAFLDSLDCVDDRNRDDEEMAASEAARDSAGTCYAKLMVECERWFQ